MAFPKSAKKERQRIIDEYLNATGRNMFVPAEFLEWLAGVPGHPAYDVFYGESDAEAALEYRKDKVRHWVSGLRITVQTTTGTGKNVRIVEHEFPAMMSPSSLRKSGGGYFVTNPEDAAHMAEHLAQAASSLQAWVDRYSGVVEASGFDLTHIKETVNALRVDVSAAA